MTKRDRRNEFLLNTGPGRGAQLSDKIRRQPSFDPFLSTAQDPRKLAEWIDRAIQEAYLQGVSDALDAEDGRSLEAL